MRGAAVVRIGAPILTLALCGCMSMSGLDGNSKYACKAPAGVTCNSVSGTYANSIHNQLPGQRQTPDAPEQGAAAIAKTSGMAPGTEQKPRPLLAAPEAAATNTANLQGLALRSQARVLRLWTKPWEDADGDLYDQGYVYVQIDQGRWQIEHVQREIRSRYAPLRPPPATSVTATPTGIAETDAPGNAQTQRPGPAADPFPSLTTPPGGAGTQ